MRYVCTGDCGAELRSALERLDDFKSTMTEHSLYTDEMRLTESVLEADVAEWRLMAHSKASQ